jgi:hypothetical protein
MVEDIKLPRIIADNAKGSGVRSSLLIFGNCGLRESIQLF